MQCPGTAAASRRELGLRLVSQRNDKGPDGGSPRTYCNLGREVLLVWPSPYFRTPSMAPLLQSRQPSIYLVLVLSSFLSYCRREKCIHVVRWSRSQRIYVVILAGALVQHRSIDPNPLGMSFTTLLLSLILLFTQCLASKNTVSA